MPETDADRDKLRVALLGQLGYLIREAEAQRSVIGRVPGKLLGGRPIEGDLSIKEIYGLLATLDREVHVPRIERLVAEDAPHFAPPDPHALAYEAGWNERAMPEIMDDVQEARRALIDVLEALPPAEWLRRAHVGGDLPGGEARDSAERDAYEMAHAICQHDADRLREVGQRLHESHMPSASS